MQIQKSATDYMVAAQDELKLFKAVMKSVREIRSTNPDAIINVVELVDDFLFSGVNGVHMCFVYERLGGSLLDLIKHYNYRGVPSSIVRPLVRDVSVVVCINLRCFQVWHFYTSVGLFTLI